MQTMSFFVAVRGSLPRATAVRASRANSQWVILSRMNRAGMESDGAMS